MVTCRLLDVSEVQCDVLEQINDDCCDLSLTVICVKIQSLECISRVYDSLLSDHVETF